MSKSFFTETVSANSCSTMETRDHAKNGVSPKDQMSRGNNLNFCKMKKTFVILIALLGFVVNSVSAKERFSVVVTVWKVYHYYDENGMEVGSTTEVAQAQTFNKCAETAQEARESAISECSTMCKNSRVNEGKKIYNGKYYECRSEKVVDDAKVEKLNQSC